MLTIESLRIAPAPEPLHEARAHINALGGTYTPTDYDKGYGAALDDALAVLEKIMEERR